MSRLGYEVHISGRFACVAPSEIACYSRGRGAGFPYLESLESRVPPVLSSSRYYGASRFFPFTEQDFLTIDAVVASSHVADTYVWPLAGASDVRHGVARWFTEPFSVVEAVMVTGRDDHLERTESDLASEFLAKTEDMVRKLQMIENAMDTVLSRVDGVLVEIGERQARIAAIHRELGIEE